MTKKKRMIVEDALRKFDQVGGELVSLSFEFIDLDNEHFFVWGLDSAYYRKFFECLEEIRRTSRKQFSEQTHPSLHIKSIFNNGNALYEAFPTSVSDRVKDRIYLESRDETFAASQARLVVSKAFEIRVAKGLGRIHGFLWDSTFNLVWIDPGHNLYCKAKPKAYEDVATVKCFSPEATRELQDRLLDLQADIDQLLAQ